MDTAFNGGSSQSFDNEGLRKLVAEVRDRLGSATGNELAPLARELTQKLLRFAEQTKERTLAARALCAAAEETEDALHDTEAAIGLFERALELNPALERAATQLDILLQRHNGTERRCIMLQQRATALDADPVASESMRAAAWRHAATAWREGAHNPSEAISAYERAIAIDPEVDSLEALADLYAARGEEGDDEQAADLLTSVAQALEGGEAIHYAQRALDLLPDHDEAMTLLEELVPQAQHGRILRTRLERYVEFAGADVDADPRRIRLARIYASEGQLQQALSCLKPAIEHGDAEAIWTRRELLELSLGGSSSMRDGETLVGVPLQWSEDKERKSNGSVAQKANASSQASAPPANAAPPAANGVNAPSAPAPRATKSAALSTPPPRARISVGRPELANVPPPTAVLSQRTSPIPVAPPPPRRSPAPVSTTVSARPVAAPPLATPAVPAPLSAHVQAPMPDALTDESMSLGRNNAMPTWLPWLVGGLVVAGMLAILLNS